LGCLLAPRWAVGLGWHVCNPLGCVGGRQQHRWLAVNDCIRSDTKPATCDKMGDAPPEDRAMLGSNLSAERCADWRQAYLDRMMPERVAVAGIILFGVKLLSGVAFWPQCDKPIASSSTSDTVMATVAHCRRHCGGTVNGLLLPLYRDCRRDCTPHCRRGLSVGTVPVWRMPLGTVAAGGVGRPGPGVFCWHDTNNRAILCSVP